jgi:hypothetical protein
MIAMGLTIIGLLGGIVHFCWPDKSPAPSRMLHSAGGAFALIFGFIALIFGLHKFSGVYNIATAWMYTVMAVLGLIGTLLSASINNVRRLTS